MTGANPSEDGETPPDDRDSSQPPTKRSRTSAARGRGVANLSTEQLERKRANDREAQRAIRERTKNQIEGLKARIAELEGSQPYHELQVVVRERDAARAEIAEHRRRLESVVSLIQPILHPASGLNDLATAAEQNPLPARPPHEPSAQPPTRPPENRINHSQHPSIASSQNGVHSPAGTESSRQWLLPGDAPTSHVRHWSGESSQFDHPQPQPHHIPQGMPLDGRMGVNFVLDNGQGTVDPNLPPPPPQPPRDGGSVGQYAPDLVPHLTMPKTIQATCQLDVIMLDFLAECHHRARQGVPFQMLAGPLYPNFTALVSPDRVTDSHLLSKLFTDIIQTFPDIWRLPEQVAVVYIMFLIMRWQIEPTQKNYERLPHWVTPRPSQLFTPHPYWINHLPWPRLRDRLIAVQPFTSFNEFFVPFTTTLSLNWPYPARDCLIRASSLNSHNGPPSAAASSPYPGSPASRPTPQPAGSTPGGSAKEDDQWVINPVFESHLRDLSNWSLGPSFGTTFPHFADTVRIKNGR